MWENLRGIKPSLWSARWGPHEYPGLNPQNLWLDPHMEKRDFTGRIKLNIFRWRGYLGLSRWTINVITSDLIKKRQGEIWHGGRDWGDVVTRQGPPEPLEAGRGKEDSSPRASGGSPTVPILEFSPGILTSDFWPPRLLFSVTEFVVICYNSHKKWVQSDSIDVTWKRPNLRGRKQTGVG